jgi:hypothetical protein
LTNEEIKNELRRGLTLTKLQRGLALTVKESRDLYKYIETLEQELCEDVGELSDGYHTFNQLYHQRAVLFACIVRQNKNKAWKSFKHSDGNYCFDSNGEWFIVGVDTPQGSYTYHFAKEYWDMFDCQELECGKEWDGHTEEDVIRLLSLEQEYCDDCDKIVESKNREFEILIKDTETYIKVTKQMDKEGIRWVSDGKLASNSEKYSRIYKYFPIYLCVDKYNRLSWAHPLFDEGYEKITPEEYLKNIH